MVDITFRLTPLLLLVGLVAAAASPQDNQLFQDPTDQPRKAYQIAAAKVEELEYALPIRKLLAVKCPKGQVLNKVTNTCGCPYIGQTYKPATKKCVCPTGQSPFKATKQCRCPTAKPIYFGGKCIAQLRSSPPPKPPAPPPPSPPPPTPPGSAPADFANLLALHNSLRAKHGSPPLVWSSTLAAHAQAWVNTFECGESDHGVDTDVGSSGFYGEGENLATYGSTDASGVRAARQTSIDAAAPDWYSEIEFYDWSNPENIVYSGDTQTGHFTQVIWKSTTEVGCAVTTVCRDIDGFFDYTVGCRYLPSGNFEGEAALNVPPLLTGR